MKIPLVTVDWPAPANVKAVVTTRCGGVSDAPWDSLNLAWHVQDIPGAVTENRRRLCRSLGLPEDRVGWLTQVHGTGVVELPSAGVPEADAATTTVPEMACAVMVADCLPVLFCDRAGRRVAAAHAGWRGLAAGVLERTLACFDEPHSVLAYLGPAIGPDAFEVGPEVRQAFVDQDGDAQSLFVPVRDDRYLADLPGLARLRLTKAGVKTIRGGRDCTFTQAERFFSYRRDGRTGRQAALIWLSS